MHGVRPADRVGTDLRESDVPHVTRLHQVGDRTDRLFDRYGRIEPCRPVDIDVIDAEPDERVREKILDRGGTRVDADECAVGRTHSAELDRQQRLVAASLERALDQQLVVAGAVEIAGIEQRDAGVERGVNRRDALPFVGGSVHAGHSHAAEDEWRDRGTGRAELARGEMRGCHAER
jgi:hypothetical protein